MSKEEEIKQLLELSHKYRIPVEGLNVPSPVASFSVKPKKNRGIKTIDLIIEIIKKSVIEQVAITREDIYRLYWIYKTDNETIMLPESMEHFSGEGWKNIVFDRETFVNHWRMQRNAIGWFKAGLASAILEGQILVLPIIKI